MEEADDLDEVMQIFLDRSAGRHQTFEPVNVDEWDPFAEPDSLNGERHISSSSPWTC